MRSKRIVTLLLALALVLSLAVPGFAAEGETGDEILTRSEFVIALFRACGAEDAEAQQTYYADVPESGELTQAVRWATENGIVNGYGNGCFGPDDPVTREQMATILYRCAQTMGQGFQGLWAFPLDFPDAAEVSSWADEAMHWVVMKGIIIGTDRGLEPRATATDDQLALVLQRWQDSLKAGEEEEESGQNPVMNFVGDYVSGRARAHIEAEGKDSARVVIEWGGSAWELGRWVMSGPLDLTTLRVNYVNCVHTELVYNDEGELESETTVYEDGTGYFAYTGGLGFTWHDDQEDRDMVFEWAFEPEETEEQEEEESGQNPVMNFVGDYVSGRARAHIEAEGKDSASVVIEWGGSAWELGRWVMSGPLDLTTLRVNYVNCIHTELVYNDDGELESETTVYEDGTGYFAYTGDLGFTWHDDQEDRDMVFAWAPAEAE